jgi:hypothetical protein
VLPAEPEMALHKIVGWLPGAEVRIRRKEAPALVLAPIRKAFVLSLAVLILVAAYVAFQTVRNPAEFSWSVFLVLLLASPLLVFVGACVPYRFHAGWALRAMRAEALSLDWEADEVRIRKGRRTRSHPLSRVQEVLLVDRESSWDWDTSSSVFGIRRYAWREVRLRISGRRRHLVIYSTVPSQIVRKGEKVMTAEDSPQKRIARTYSGHVARALAKSLDVPCTEQLLLTP